jgi:hypothetical protein
MRRYTTSRRKFVKTGEPYMGTTVADGIVTVITIMIVTKT